MMFMNTVYLERKEIQSQNQAKIKNLKRGKGRQNLVGYHWGIILNSSDRNISASSSTQISTCNDLWGLRFLLGLL